MICLESHSSKLPAFICRHILQNINWLIQVDTILLWTDCLIRYRQSDCTLLWWISPQPRGSGSRRKSNTDVLELLHRLECEPYFRDRTPSYALFYRMWSHFTLSFIVCATSMRRLYISACVCSAYFIFITLSLTMFIYLIFTISKSKLCVLVCFSENEL